MGLLEAEAEMELGREDVERKLGTTEAVVIMDMLVVRGMEDDAIEDVGTDAVSVGALLEVSVGASVEVSVGASVEVSIGASVDASVGVSTPESVGASAPESVGASAPASVALGSAALSVGSAEPVNNQTNVNIIAFIVFSLYFSISPSFSLLT